MIIIYVHYKSTTEHGNADALSRLPLPVTTPSLDTQSATAFNIGQIQALPVTFQHIQKATRRDPVLGKVYHYVIGGWPSHVPDELKPYKNRETELSIENGCLMWGVCVVVPQSLHAQVLKTIHANHPGITRMKAIARSYFWWSGLDRAVEEMGKTCNTCQSNQPNPPTAPIHPWVWPDSPWKCIHIDFAGLFQGHTFW